jgi:hypothetical protein
MTLWTRVPIPFFSTIAFTFLHNMHWASMSSNYMSQIAIIMTVRLGHKCDRPWSSILEHVLCDQTSSTHVAIHNPITFVEPNRIQKQCHKWTSWINKPFAQHVATPLWAKCEDETHTPKSGDLESIGTSKNSELDFRGQNTSYWGVLYINEKVLKCKCPKWPRMSHLDIYSPSYGQKKGRESNWQFDSRPLKVGNRPLPDVCRRSAIRHWKSAKESYNFGSDLTPIEGWSQEIWMSKVPGV